MRVAAPVIVALTSLAPQGVTIPFVWTQGQVEVAVTVNGAAATFVLDTGSEYSIVSTRLAQKLGLRTERRGARDFADGVTLAAGPITLARQVVMVMPFDTFYARGRHIDGFLGYDLFDRYAVKIDFRGRTLTCWDARAFTPPNAAVEVPITFAGRLPVVAGSLRLADGRTFSARLMVDTGASQSVMLRHPYATAHGLFALAERETTAPSLESGTRRLVAIPADQLTIAGWRFDRPEVLAFTEPIGSAGGTETDGLIGNTLLSRFVLYVDYARRRLFFEPARHSA